MEATFQSITMSIAVVILVICLIIIAVALYRSKYTTQFPPVVADCPDYWLDMSEGDGSRDTAWAMRDELKRVANVHHWDYHRWCGVVKSQE